MPKTKYVCLNFKVFKISSKKFKSYKAKNPDFLENIGYGFSVYYNRIPQHLVYYFYDFNNNSLLKIFNDFRQNCTFRRE